MNRLIRFSLVIATAGLMLSLTMAGSASATTYYIAANGSDTNSGTSKTSPWLHAPGMKTCVNTCGSVSPKPGDQFIFRGGDTWHWGNSSASPYVGSNGWNWNWSGSSGSAIYIGVDQTWYSGGSWARPIFSGDNPLSTSFVGSCSYDESGLQFINLTSLKYVTVDNFEWSGKCWKSNSTYTGVIYDPGATYMTFSNNYFHGWTTLSSSNDSDWAILGGSPCCTATYNQIVGNVFDGSDSSQAAANSAICSASFDPPSPCQSGGAIYQDGYDVHGNVFRYLSNFMIITDGHTIHDNLFEYLFTTYDHATHSNVVNEVSNIAGSDTYFYNNVVRHTHVTEDLYITVGNSAYFFNNVFYDNMNYIQDVAPSNCIGFGAVSPGGTETAYVYNNTFDNSQGGCQINLAGDNAPNYAWNGTALVKNNHLIGYSPQTLPSFTYCSSGAHCTFTDAGNEIWQTESTANGQGYTSSNNYAPTSSTGATVAAGANLSTQCSIFSANSELCGGTSDGATESASAGGETAVFPGITMVPRNSSWDVGAYEFGSGSSAPAPPTGLAVVVQ
ncbi:MAG: hypothetical protein WCC95_10540 [Candidatus Sulfotelmatobacter sp.]